MVQSLSSSSRLEVVRRKEVRAKVGKVEVVEWRK